MPRLIRLTTEDDNCYFNNDFKQDILIKPNSKIALQNFCCEIKEGNFTLNSSNNKIYYQSKSGELVAVYITPGYYDKDNVDILFSDMANQLNAALRVDIGSEYGRQWSVDTVDSKVILQQKSGNLSFNSNASYVNKVNMDAANTFKRSGGATSYDSFFYINKAFTKGCGGFYGKITTLATTAGDKLAWGLTTQQIKSTDTEVTKGDYKYGLLVTGTSYRYIKNQKEYAAAIPAPQVNDELFISLSENKINIDVYRGSTKYPILSETYTGETLYPAATFIAPASDIIVGATARFSTDPYYSSVTETNDNIITVAPSPGGSAGSSQYLEFDDVDFARFLGFENRRIPSSGYIVVKNFTATAENEFKPTSLSESFVVELLNINLESYEGLLKQRKNILASIVNQQVVNDRVHFVAPYPQYIDMNNANPITLRNIRARILKEDLSEITVNGFSQMTLLID